MGKIIYVDGESHFIRSQEAARNLFGNTYNLNDLDAVVAAVKDEPKRREAFVRKARACGRRVGQPPSLSLSLSVESGCKFFWMEGRNFGMPLPQRVYFTSFPGDENGLHAMNVLLRRYDFEPCIVKERRDLSKSRDSARENDGLIEKPKGVDIALAVRMLEDAAHNAFDTCDLYTSDVDYIPVIEAVQRKGKAVSVYGYRNGIGKNSRLEFIPSSFVDLASKMEQVWQYLATTRPPSRPKYPDLRVAYSVSKTHPIRSFGEVVRKQLQDVGATDEELKLFDEEIRGGSCEEVLSVVDRWAKLEVED